MKRFIVAGNWKTTLILFIGITAVLYWLFHLWTPEEHLPYIPRGAQDFSYTITPSAPLLPHEGTLVITTHLASAGRSTDYEYSVSPRKKPDARLGITLGFTDLYIHDMDAVTKATLESLSSFTNPTFLNGKTVADVDTNGHTALAVLLRGFPSQFSYLFTNESSNTKPIELQSSIRDGFALRSPWVDILNAAMRHCAHSNDITIIHDFVSYAYLFQTIYEAVVSLHCITKQVLLVGIDANLDRPEYKADLAREFADIEVLSLPDSPILWFAAYVEPFTRPISDSNIARGAMDVPAYLKRASTKVEGLPYEELDVSLYPPTCQQSNYIDTVISTELVKDTISQSFISSCVIAYEEDTVIKVASSDFGARETFFLERIHKEASYLNSAAFFQIPDYPYVDDLTGQSSSILKGITGTPLSAANKSDLALWKAADFVQVAQDAITILMILQRAQVIHREISVNNVIIHDVEKRKRLGLVNLMYAVSHSMPFSSAIIHETQTEPCDIGGMAAALEFLVDLYPLLATITSTMRDQHKNCSFDSEYLFSLITPLLEQESLCTSSTLSPITLINQTFSDHSLLTVEGPQNFLLTFSLINATSPPPYPISNQTKSSPKDPTSDPEPDRMEKAQVLYSIRGNDVNMIEKMDLVDWFYTKIPCSQNLTALDIGSNTGFICLRSLMRQLDQCTSVDTYPQSLGVGITEKIRDALHFNTSFLIKNSLEEIKRKQSKYNIVFAFSVLDRLLACESDMTLDSVVKNLRSITTDLLVIEWVENNKKDNRYLNACSKEKDCKYSISEFENALKRNFISFRELDTPKNTHSVYIAFASERCKYS